MQTSVIGLSSLREKEKAPAAVSEQSKALQAYLNSKYSSAGDADAKRKKKKKRKNPGQDLGGVHIVDADSTGFLTSNVPAAHRKPSTRKTQLSDSDDEDEDGGEDDAPVVANPGEAERLRRQAAQERTDAKARGWETVPAAKHSRQPTQQGTYDTSPPRRPARDVIADAVPDLSPPRGKGGSSPDLSPPRRGGAASPDLSPPRQRHAEAADLSPPRHTGGASPDLSPPRRRAGDSAADLSPPRRRHDESAGMPSSAKRAAAAADLSPPRRRGGDSAADLSPPRRGRDAARDMSPPRRRRDEGGAGQAPARQAQGGDMSPPRRPAHGRGHRDSLPPEPPAALDAGKGRFRTMADGMAAGLVAGRDIRQEMDRKRAAERAQFDSLGAEATGRGAKTVYRDSQGKVVASAEELQKLKEAEEAAKKPKAEAPEWGGGLKQMRDRQQRAEEMQQEAAKPFARTKDDADLDAHLRERERFGDPMAHLVRKRKAQAGPAAAVIPEHMAKQMRKSGFMVPQEVPAHSWLKRGMGPPPNRYSIKPGRHWDGVDRSNGFETEMFRQRTDQAALAQEARMWAQSDM